MRFWSKLKWENGAANAGVGPILGRIFKDDNFDLSASAIAVLPPRDYVLVFDNSGSMDFDSTLAHIRYMINLRNGVGVPEEYPDAAINLRNIWDTFPNSPGDPGYDSTKPGPTFGYFMHTFGYGIPDTETVPGGPAVCKSDGSYRPASDPGLIYLPIGTNWNDAGFSHKTQVETSLIAQGYNAEERQIIMSSYVSDYTLCYRRVGIVLGIYAWNSGIEGPEDDPARWESEGWPAGVGNGDDYISGIEVDTDYVDPPYGLAHYNGWNNWISAMQNSYNYWHAFDNFKCYYGVKTLWHHLLYNAPLKAHHITWHGNPIEITPPIC